MEEKAKVALVAAMSKNSHALGKNNDLLWHIPEDMKRFKALTASHPVVMGRKTFESIIAILGKPLPGRPNIVITRNPHYAYEGVIVVSSLEEGLKRAEELDPEEIHIGGGAEIYTQALPYVDLLFLTFVDDEKDADTFFPPFEKDFTVVKEHEKKDHNGLSYQWVDYKRI
nr:Dihydrofolate reductase [uncultured bacterium]